MNKALISDHAIPAMLLTDGTIAVLFAAFAHALGFDPNPDWGRSRIIIFLVGALLILASVYLFNKNPASIESETIKTFTLVGHVWAFILLVYVWFITFGTFTEWRASTRYYSLLADAFGDGQLHVDVDPGSALLAADDPYNNEGRPPFDDDVWDLSLYKGKLYLYWGPVPALLMAPVQLALKAGIPDLFPVFFFFCGLLVVNTLILMKMRTLFFADIPMRYAAASLLVLGLILPIPWSLSTPDVYEAAIGAGQFFLIGGIYFVILAIEKTALSGERAQSPLEVEAQVYKKGFFSPDQPLHPPSSAGGLPEKFFFLAGLFWACSVGSRAINVLSIFFLTAFTLYWVWKTQPESRIRLSASLLIPLAVGAILIGWYNYARFDSPLEFGLRYQITVQNMNRDMPLAFEMSYLPHNVTAYILQPFRFESGFPFMRPVGYTAMLQSRGIAAPGLYAAGNVTGVLFFAPFLLLAFLPFFQSRSTIHDRGADLKRLVIYLLAGSFIISFGGLLLYYYGQMRFLADAVSQITLLAGFGYWGLIRKSPAMYRYAANLLIAFTLIVSLLLSVTGESGRMEKLNPGMMERLGSMVVEP